MQETQVQFLGQEDPLEKGMATYPSIFAWEIPWIEEPGGLHAWGYKELDMTEQLNNNINDLFKVVPDAHLVGEGLRVQQVCLCFPVSLSVYTVLLLA